MKILNYGSLNIDDVYQVEHILRPKETLASLSVQTFCGGKGLNQSVALAKAGAEVFHAGCVGEDGAILREYLERNGVCGKFIHTVPGKSGHTVIQVDSQGQNCILLYGGANQRQDRGQIRKVLDAFSSGDALLLQNEINELDYLILLASERGMKIILNPSPIDEKLLESDLSAVELFVMNEVEGEALTGKQVPEEMLTEMQRQYPKASVLLTLGEKGAFYQNGMKRWFQPAFAVEAVDTTAAGDTFTGYFIAGLVSGLSPEENLHRSAKAASIAVSRKGAADSIPRFDEF